MSKNIYDVYITGKVLDGTTPETARARIATLFNISPDKAQALLDGQPHRIKQGADREAAKRLLQALKKAGVEGGAKQQPASAPQPSATSTDTQSGLQLAPEGTPVLRDDERPRAPTAEIDINHLQLEPAIAAQPSQPTQAPITAPDYGLAPAGSQLEQVPDTREQLNPDISQLSLAEAGSRLLEENNKPPPAAPSVDHIQLQN